MEYNDYSYLFPPRPEKPISVDLINFYENRGWHAQIKKNGTCTMIFTNGRDVIFKTRHGEFGEHRMWTPKAEHIKFFHGHSHKWNVYVAELLHSKTPHIKDTLFIHDKVVDEGIHLVGTTFAERQLMLHDEFSDVNIEDHYNRINEHFVVANTFTKGLTSLYKGLTNIEDEGLVLKNPSAVLKACFKSNANSNWQVKSRVPHKNYSF